MDLNMAQTFTAARKIAALLDTMSADELDDFGNSFTDALSGEGVDVDSSIVKFALMRLGRDERQRKR